MVSSSEPMYDSIRLRLVWVSSGVPRLFDAVRDGVTDSSHSADSIGLNEKQIVATLYQLCYGLSQNSNWFEWDDTDVLKDCHLNQQGLVLSISITGRSCNRQKANANFHNLSSCNTRSINELVSGATLHKLWQPMIDDYIHYYCVYTAKLTLASQVLVSSCAQIVNIWDPEYQKNYFYWKVKSYPYGILLFHLAIPLWIFRISKVSWIRIYIQEWKYFG